VDVLVAGSGKLANGEAQTLGRPVSTTHNKNRQCVGLDRFFI
jgi:hypothetical protein